MTRVASRPAALALLATLLAVAPRSLLGQACASLPSLRGAGGGTAIGGASFVTGSQTFTGGVLVGSRSGVFGGGAVGLTTYDGLDGHTLTVAPQLGVELAPSERSALRFCPIVAATFGFGPNGDVDGTSIEMSTRGVGAGLAVGGTIPVGQAVTTGRGLSLIPSAALTMQYSHAKVTIDGTDFGGSDTYGLLDLGFGFSFNQSVTFVPSIVFPIGVEGAEPSLSLSMGFRFGARGR